MEILQILLQKYFIIDVSVLLITKSNSNTYLLSYLIGTITFNEIHS